MSRPERSLRGAIVGLAIGAIFFAADLAGALAAIADLFDAKPAAFILLGVAALTTLLASAAVGAALAAAWPLSRWPHLPAQRRLPAALLLALVVATGGYLSRRGRGLPDPGPRPEVSATRPHSVLWVVIDTLRADTLYGADTSLPLTPKLRQFADEALVMTDVESASGWTIPSVATLMTGIHPVALYSARRFLPSWAPTVAERLFAAGYETGALCDNALLERRNGFAQGFESWQQRSAYRFAFSLPGFRLLPTPVREWLREAVPAAYQGSAGVTDAALERLQTPREVPLFLYVHYMDVHHPYYPHPELGNEAFDAEPTGMHFLVEALRRDPTAVPSAEEMRRVQQRYAGEVRALDRDLGRLLDGWDRHLGADSLIVITADHGEEFLDHGELGHGQSMYRELVHVPTIVRLPTSLAPSMAPGTRLTPPLGQVDILPTTLDVVGITPEAGADGILPQGESWLGWLRGDADAPNRPLFGTSSHYGRRIYRWREGPWARLYIFDKESDGVRHQLFDVDRDPGERADVFSTHATRVAEMSARFEPFLDAQEAARDPKPATDADIGEARDALRALGYVQ